ncbi:hypothetical protein ABT337_01210 [Saccharopolyspora hirsuta]|uniref:Uncharacterized protein n=1 Tax=Saccharopolyspora hirsuta TaxID=1837 RepID=A0A5M7BZP0_SACHI|nr:hypothetical protein [Saccharopolyspora hirsuta]KAA5831775.1 hypothetical protein F1721_18200 [Saccharopolyspora hirsuta]
MSVEPFRFVANVLRAGANKKGSKLWLPNLLESLKDEHGNAVLPIKAEKWTVPKVDGDPGKTAQARAITAGDRKLVQILKKYELPQDFKLFVHPTRPWPSIDLLSVQVDGLPNAHVGDVSVSQHSTTTLRCVVPVTFGHYQDEPKLAKKVGIAGKYSAHLELGISDAKQNPPELTKRTLGKSVPELPHWPELKLNATGGFALQFNALQGQITCDISVSGSGSGRKLALSVVEVKCWSNATTPIEFDDKKFTVDPGNTDFTQLWIDGNRTMLLNMLNSGKATNTFFTSVNTELSKENNRKALATELTNRFHQVIDDALGAVPNSGLYDGTGEGLHPVTQYLFDRLRTALNNKDSALYPAATILSLTDPKLDPYKLPGDVKLPDQTVWEKKLHSIYLKKDSQLTGASNALFPAADMKAIAGGISAVLKLGEITTETKVKTRDGTVKVVPLPPITLSGNFTAKLGDDPDELDGSYTVKIKKASLAIEASITGKDASDLTVKFSKLVPSVALADLTITVKTGGSFDNEINQELNKDTPKQAVVDGIKAEVEKNREAIGTRVTEDARKLIKQNTGT